MTSRTIGRRNSAAFPIITVISLTALLLSFRAMVRYSVWLFLTPTAYHDLSFYRNGAGRRSGKGERAEGRLVIAPAIAPRSLVTRVAKVELGVPQGISTRKVKAIGEELCGHSFSASAISEFNRKLDGDLGRSACRELDREYPLPNPRRSVRAAVAACTL
jgi:hypothetical protein